MLAQSVLDKLSSIYKVLAIVTRSQLQVFYGHPVADSLFGVESLDIYITTGYVYHHASDPYSQTLAPGQGINADDLVGLGDNPCKDSTTDCTITYYLQPTHEYVLVLKLYYNINWPFHWRLGAAESLSYI